MRLLTINLAFWRSPFGDFGDCSLVATGNAYVTSVLVSIYTPLSLSGMEQC
jgi:hypothetical protein